MKAVGLDTCVVLRLLIGEPEQQARCALQFVEECFFKGMDVFVSDIVVAEVYHAARYHYGVPAKTAAGILFDFLSSPMVTPSGHALTVLGEYKGAGAGLVDHLIRMDFLDHAHEIVTFDRKFAKLVNVTLLEAKGTI